MKPPALQAVDGSFQLTHGLFQNAAGTGGVEPHIPVQASAEGTAVVEAQLCLLDHEVMKRFVAQAQIPAVKSSHRCVSGIGSPHAVPTCVTAFRYGVTSTAVP